MPHLSDDRPALEITGEMLDAGAEALAEASLAEPLRDIVEKVFVAMFYANEAASLTKP